MIKSFRRLLAALLLLGPVALSAQSGTLPVLPERIFPQLNSILAAAVQQSPRMIALNLDQEIADASLLQAKSGLLPDINGYIRKSEAREKREDQPGTLSTDKLYYSLTITQPLYHWGERRNTATMGEISRKMAERQYAEGYRLLVQQIRSNYLELIVLKARLAALGFNLEQAEETLRATEARLSRGEISDADAFQPRIAVEQSRLLFDRTTDTFDDSKRRFRVLTGQPAPADEAIPAEIPEIPSNQPQVAGLLTGFLNQGEPLTRTGLNLKDQVESARLYYANQRTRLRPKLNLVAGISQDEQRYTTSLAPYGLQSNYIGVQLNWNIFDGFSSRAATRSALASLRKHEASYQQYTETVGQDAERSARQLGFNERQMRIQEKLFDSNRSFLAYHRDQRALGLSSDVEIARAQVQYNAGFVQALEARASYLQAVGEFVGLVAEDPALNHLNAARR